MLTAVRQLAAADFIAVVHWTGEDVVELVDCDPAIVPTQALRTPPRWHPVTSGSVLEFEAPRQLLPSAIVHALKRPAAATCIVHGPTGARGERDSSLILVWLDPEQVPLSIRRDPGLLKHLLVGRTPRVRTGAVPTSAARLDAIMASVPQGIIFVDEARGEAIVNPAAAAFLQVPAGVLLRTELAAAMEQFFARLKHQEFVRHEATRIARDPDARIDDWTWEIEAPRPATLRVMSSPIAGEAGQGRLWTFDDVSHERALLRQLARHRVIEEKMRQMQKLELVGQLAASVAHDFNNLLTIIGGSAEMLDFAELDPERRVDLHNIAHATERARRLTRQLLTFTRQQVEQSEGFVLDDRLRETASLLDKVLAPTASLALDLRADGAMVFADPSQIELALLNLLANARDAMPAGGVVTLRTEIEHLTGERLLGSPNPLAGTHVAVSVSDTGTGFDEETRAHMFEPFFTTKPSGQGTGLGLATVLAITQRCGGGVRCGSVPGAGTTFTVLLPRASATSGEPQEPGRPARRPLAAPVLRILLVDDDAGPRDTMRRLLVHEGFAVEVAESGSAALERLTAAPEGFDALVTDSMMPEMSGRELLERIRIRWPDLPAVMLSGFVPDQLTAGVLQRLHVGFMAKPCSGAQLAAAIHQQLGRATSLTTPVVNGVDPD